MNKKRNIIIGLIVCVLLMTVVFFVFNHGKSNEQVVTEYFELLKKKDYKQMYQMLDQKTVYTPTQKYFIEKHKEIYDVINPSNIQVKVIDEKDNVQKELLSTESEYHDFADIISEQVMVSSHDGIEVPMSLVYKKGIKKNSDNEVFIFVYGAYGESLSPFFSPIFLDWAAQGGILAFPHVRGGGEKGKEWHEQGMKNLKYNSWKDLIACTEALIDMNLTKEGLISLYTNSAGGVTAAMAVNERPDLYSSFIAEVPRLNPFGLESSNTASSTSYLEYGTVKDSAEYVGLIKMDPYLNIKPNTNYPATLIMPSYNDDRIPLWDNGKYIAKLQKYNTANTAILMDIDYDSGHETFGDYNETIRLYSKIFSFAKSNMKN